MMSSMLPLLEASMWLSLSMMAFSEAISVATSSRVMRRTSSMASTLSGSAIARNSLFSRRETGTTLWLCAISRGTRSATSMGMVRRARLMGGVFSTRPIETAMSAFADVGLFEDQLEQARAFLLLLLQQFLDLLDRQQAVFHQGVGDAFAKCFDWRHGFIGRLCGGC